MYTLRIINPKIPAKRIQNTSLGNWYNVIYDVKEYDSSINTENVLIVVDSERAHKHIMKEDFACIMTESGKTFEVLNRP